MDARELMTFKPKSNSEFSYIKRIKTCRQNAGNLLCQSKWKINNNQYGTRFSLEFMDEALHLPLYCLS